MNEASVRLYLKWLVSLSIVEAFSLLLFQSNQGMAISLVLIALIAIGLAIKRPYWLALISVAELIVGGKGYLFFADIAGQSISVRMVLFIVLMIALLYHVIRHRPNHWPRWAKPIGILFLWIVLMAGWGIWQDHSLKNIWLDVNAFGYLLLIWAWWYFFRTNRNWKEHLVVLLLAGASWVGIKSWITQLLFAQDFDWIRTYYTWIRRTGIGEITFITENTYRIFFQSQIYTLLVFCLTLGGWLVHQFARWWAWPLMLSALGVYISLSRSFWVGLACGLLALVIALLWQHRWKNLLRFWIILPTGIAVWMLSSWALNFPYVIRPYGVPTSSNAVVERLRGEASQQASSARVNQIRPLLEAIQRHPIIGHGFGATVTYFSTDPRVRGWRTATAFELGYLDAWLEIGLVGLGLYAWWVLHVLRRLRMTTWHLLFLGGTVALLATHLTTPYLNHPLGLGWLMLVTLYSYD